jgi:hypothetical protein
VTEWTESKNWTVTEWTESKNWTESTEAYGAKRSASTETYEATRSDRRHSPSAKPMRRRPRGLGHPSGIRGGLAASYVVASLISPIVIWHRNDLSK